MVQQVPVPGQQTGVACAVAGVLLTGTGQQGTIWGQTVRGESRAAPAGPATAKTETAAATRSENRVIERRIV